MESHLQLKRSPHLAGLKPKSARSAGQPLTYYATDAPEKSTKEIIIRGTLSLSYTTKNIEADSLLYNYPKVLKY